MSEYHKSELHRKRMSAVHKGKIVSEKQKKKQSETMKRLYASGYKHPLLNKPRSKETREKISKSKLSKHYHASDFVKQRVREAQTGRIVSKETREKMRLGRLNKKTSDVTKLKLREAAKKRWLNKEYRKKFSEERMGEKNPFYKKKHSEESRKKMSLSTKGKNKGKIPWNKNKRNIYSPEVLEKNRSAHLGKQLQKGILKSEEYKRKISETKKRLYAEGKIKSWNKDLTKEIDERILKYANKLKGRCGELSSNWLNGKSFEPYSKEFNKRFKKEIKERDGCCMLCNIGFEDLKLLKRQIAIHHINYDKLLSIPENCVSLCNSCHTKTNFNRKQWPTFFQNLLSERYGYKYSQENIILDIDLKGGLNKNVI